MTSLPHPHRVLALLVPLLALFGAADLAAQSGRANRPQPSGPTSVQDREIAWQRHLELERTSPFRGLPWRAVGPVVQGGRVVDIEVDPSHPFRFYVAYASGGLWVTHNNGRTFEPLFDRQATIIMGDIAVDPQRPRTLWVGTGENNSSRSSYGGFGIFRSTDGGATWENRGLKESDRIGRILVDPRDSDRIYVAALGKLYTEGGQRGVYRTTDGGATWDAVLPGEGFVGAIDLQMDPADPDTLYAAMWERSRRPWNFVEAGPGSGLYKSTDGGTTWAPLTNGLPTDDAVGRIGISICAEQPETVYVVVDHQEALPEAAWDLGGSAVTPKRLRSMSKKEFLAQDPDEIERFIRSNDFAREVDSEGLIARVRNDELTMADLLAELDDANASLFQTDIRGLEIYRTDDGGSSWRRTHDKPIRQVVHTYGYYFGQVRVAPDDPDRIYVAGVPLIRSLDGGRTFTNVQTPEVHVDHHALWIDPEHSQRLILGNDGGIDLSYDAGDTWIEVDGPPVGQFYTVAVDDRDPYHIYGGLQDNGTLSGSSQTRVGRDPWKFLGGGDGMYVQVDPRDRAVYLGYQFGFYMRIDPDGTRHDVRPRDAIGETALRYNWATPILLSPHQSDIVYFGTQRLYRSMDRGENWTALSPDLSRNPARGDVPFATITSVAESPLEFGLIWAGTDDGFVHVSEDGGRSWRVADAGVPLDRWVSRLEPSRVDRDRCYLSLTGYRDDDRTAYLFVTDDCGKSWRSIGAGLPAESINVVREDPVVPDLLYVGTDRGVYASPDRGSTWHALPGELPNVPVHDLVVHPTERELVAGTHGRSVWVIDALPIQELTLAAEPSVTVYPLESISASRSWRSRRSPWFHRVEDAPRQRAPFYAPRAGTAQIRIVDEQGERLRQWTMEVEAGVHVAEWDLLLDAELALAVERARTEAALTEEPDDPPRTPWADAIRLDHPLYITPGSYRLKISVGGETASADFEVDAPEPYEPRTLKEKPIRGRTSDDDR